jgi:hypothetical protein
MQTLRLEGSRNDSILHSKSALYSSLAPQMLIACVHIWNRSVREWTLADSAMRDHTPLSCDFPIALHFAVNWRCNCYLASGELSV